MAIEPNATTQVMMPGAATRGSRGLFAQTLRRLLRDQGARTGLILVIALALIGTLAPLIAPHDPYAIGVDRPFQPPSWENLLGTDNLGRDVLSRLVFGARISIRVSFFSALAALALAAPLGLAAGYFGGAVDGVICRFFDTIFAFPSILVGVAMVAILGSSETNVVAAIGIVSIPTMGRLTRVGVLAQKSEDYVLAAKALGASEGRIIARHVLPNVFPGLLVQLTLVMAYAVLLEAAFSFLGLGSRPPTPSWGVMLNEGRNFLSLAPWLGLYAGITVTLMILGFNLLGDGLQRVLNPRLINR